MRNGRGIAAGLFACSLLNLAPVAHAADGENVRLYGTLVAEPCVLQPGDENIAIDFGKIIDKYIYINGRSPSQPFQLHLLECDLSIGKQVSVTFKGNESEALPGLLAVTPMSSGIAIGIENQQKINQPINTTGENVNLSKGSNTLNFSAYVQGEADAITKKSIVRGVFNAVATFVIAYQ